MGLPRMVGMGGGKGTHSSLRCRRGFSECQVRWYGGPSRTAVVDVVLMFGVGLIEVQG